MSVGTEPISLPSQMIGPPPIQFGNRVHTGEFDRLVSTIVSSCTTHCETLCIKGTRRRHMESA